MNVLGNMMREYLSMSAAVTSNFLFKSCKQKPASGGTGGNGLSERTDGNCDKIGVGGGQRYLEGDILPYIKGCI